MLKSVNPTTTAAWKSLEEHFEEIQNVHMRDLFSDNPNRFRELSIQFGDLLVDYSKNRIDDKTINLLIELAETCGLKEAIKGMFSGEKINRNEGRAVLHTALRNFTDKELIIDGENILPLVHNELKKIQLFTTKLHSGEWTGHSGKKIKQIINIGIGGSDLGPVMVTEALKPYWIDGIETYYISNVDGSHIHETLRKSIMRSVCL